MRRMLAMLATACGVAVLFATAAQPERRVIRLGVSSTASAACYSITWTKHSTPVVARKPCIRIPVSGAPAK